MQDNRILTVQDLSCVGKCSLTVALPVLSACGLEVSVLPSALLSTNTAKCFEGNTFLDLTGEMEAILAHWTRRKLGFSAALVGYLGNETQLEYIINNVKPLLGGGILIVDPVMGDNGLLYKGFDDRYVKKMRELLPIGDYILPNITEACLLTGIPYSPSGDFEFIDRLIKGLCSLGAKNIILTGVQMPGDSYGVAVWNGDEIRYYGHKRINRGFYGTGDIFSSVFAGALLQGKTPYDAVVIAADFVVMSMENTAKYDDNMYGVKFEPFLNLLYDRIKN